MPYGLRMLRAWIVGIMLAGAYAFFAWPSFDRFAPGAAENFWRAFLPGSVLVLVLVFATIGRGLLPLSTHSSSAMTQRLAGVTLCLGVCAVLIFGVLNAAKAARFWTNQPGGQTSFEGRAIRSFIEFTESEKRNSPTYALEIENLWAQYDSAEYIATLRRELRETADWSLEPGGREWREASLASEEKRLSRLRVDHGLLGTPQQPAELEQYVRPWRFERPQPSQFWGRSLQLLPGLLLLLVPPLLIRWKERITEHDTLRRWLLAGRGGSSRWAGPAKLSRYAFDPFNAWRLLLGWPVKCDGVYLGVSLFDDDFAGRHIVVRDDAHMLTIGQTGSGKSVTSIWPTLALYSGSAIVIDPKGEHAKMCGPYRGGGGPANGSRMPNAVAHYLDPFGRCASFAPSARYNLLSEIDMQSKDARKLISAISVSCIQPSQDGKNKYWEETARGVLDGVIAHVLTTDRYPRTLPGVADLLLGIDPETGIAVPSGLIDPETKQRILSPLENALMEMRINGAAGGLPQRAADALDTLSERERGIVTSELRNALKWASDPSMRANLSASDFSFRDLGNPDRKTTIFIALPFGDMVEQSRWLRAVTNLSMRILEGFESKPTPPVLYVLDELPQYGRQLDAIKDGMVTMRSAGVKLWAFVQNWKQLTECFGQEGARNFESSGTVQVYGVNDNETAQWVSEKLGKRIVKDYKGLLRRREVGQREVNLADAAYVATQLGKTTPLQYVFPCDGPPMRLKRRAFRTIRIEGQRFKGLPLDGHFSG